MVGTTVRLASIRTLSWWLINAAASSVQLIWPRLNLTWRPSSMTDYNVASHRPPADQNAHGSLAYRDRPKKRFAQAVDTDPIIPPVHQKFPEFAEAVVHSFPMHGLVECILSPAGCGPSAWFVGPGRCPRLRGSSSFPRLSSWWRPSVSWPLGSRTFSYNVWAKVRLSGMSVVGRATAGHPKSVT